MRRFLIFALAAVLLFGAGVVSRPVLSRLKTRLVENTRSADAELRVFDQSLYARRSGHFAALGETRRIVFLGDSRVQEGEWAELLARDDISNRGISGDTTAGVLARLASSVPTAGGVCLLQVGINDLKLGATPDEVVGNYRRILEHLVQEKRARVIAMPILLAGANDPELNAQIAECNPQLRDIAVAAGATWLDVNATLSKDGALRSEFTTDGVHLNATGYKVWSEQLAPLLPERSVPSP